ncbi:MAG: M20 family metallopeptidase [Pseudomonadota bacterium]
MKTLLDPVALTKELLAYNTINPPGQERLCTEYLGKLLEERGFKTSIYEFSKDRTNLIARLEGNGHKAPICFTGHMDIVPLGAVAWEKDPFGGEVVGDRLYGRGSSDMKGGLAAMVIAGLRVARLSRGESDILMVITAGEETGCTGAYNLVQLGPVLGRAGALVVAEPTSNYPLIGHKGALWLRARTTGVTAHGSMPEQGVNAIYKAAEAVRRLQQFEFNASPHPLLGLPTLNVGTIEGGMNINSVPDQALIGIDIRTVPGQRNQDVYEKLISLLGPEVTLDRLVDVEGVFTNSENEWIQEVFHIVESFRKERVTPRGAPYFTDASLLTPAMGTPPTVILGPGEPTMAHKTDEFCLISKIEEITEAYVEIAKKWAGL